MIRLLTEKDRLSVLEYLYKDKDFNIFPIGDIEAFGFDTEYQKVYGEFDEFNQYLSIFLKYRDNGIYYSHIDTFNKAYLPIIENSKLKYFSGKKELIDLLRPYVKVRESKPMYFCYANKILSDQGNLALEIKILKTKEDCVKLYDLLKSIDEFGIKDQSKDRFVESKLKSIKMGVTLYVEKDGEFVGTVATTAETKVNAMVVGVATRIDFRNQGLATQLMLSLMNMYIINKKKSLCLFYDNPKAGKIYLGLGFEYIGKWEMLTF